MKMTPAGKTTQVRVDAVNEHTRSPVIACRIVEYLGFNHDAGTYAAIVEYNGKDTWWLAPWRKAFGGRGRCGTAWLWPEDERREISQCHRWIADHQHAV